MDPEEERINYLLLLSRTDEAADLLHAKGQTSDAKLIKSISKYAFVDPLTKHMKAEYKEEHKTK